MQHDHAAHAFALRNQRHPSLRSLAVGRCRPRPRALKPVGDLCLQRLLLGGRQGRPEVRELPLVCFQVVKFGELNATRIGPRTKDVFLVPLHEGEVVRRVHHPQRAPVVGPEKTAVLCELSLYLSRACLGKQIAFKQKWLKTTRWFRIRVIVLVVVAHILRALVRHRAAVVDARRPLHAAWSPRRPAETRPSFTFPIFDPSLSWQIVDH